MAKCIRKGYALADICKPVQCYTLWFCKRLEVKIRVEAMHLGENLLMTNVVCDVTGAIGDSRKRRL